MSFRKSKFFKSTRTGLWAALLVIVIFFVVSLVLLYEPLTVLHNSKFVLWIMTSVFAISILLLMWWRTNKLNLSEEARDLLYREKEEKAEQIKGVYERVSDAFIALDKNWRFVYINKKAGELARRNPTTLIGKNIWEEFPETLGSDTYKAYHRAMADQLYARDIGYSEPLDLWYENNIYPSSEGLSVFVRDISEMKKTEKSLKESENNLKQIMENSAEMIWSVDRGYRLITFNKGFSDDYNIFFGVPPSPGKIQHELYPPEAQAVWKAKIDEALAGNDVWFERSYVLHNETKHIEVHLHPIRNGNRIEGVSCFIMNITERKQDQQALVESERRLRAIYNTEPECIKILGPKGELLDMNPAGLAMIEADNLEIVKGKSVLGIIAPKDRDAFARLTQNVFSGESGILEFEITGFKGTHRLLETHAVPLKDSGGKIISLLAITRDVTERSKGEQAIKESEEKFRTLVQQAAEGIFVVDTDGNYLEVNESAARLTGYSQEELKKMNAREIVDSDELKKNPIRLEEIMTGKPVFIERIIRKKDKTLINAEISAKLMNNGQVISIMRDITERKLAEEKIKENEAKYRTIMQQAGDSIVLFDNTGHILEANESALDLLGYSSNEYKKIPLKDIFFEEDLKEKPLQFDLLNKGESTINRRRLKRKDGTGVETEAHAKMLSDGRYIVVVRNLTERIKAEQKLFEKDQQLREISSSIPGLIYQFVLEPTGEFHFPFISESAKALIEVSPAEVYENVANAFAKVHPDDLPGLYESIYVSAKTLTPWLYVFKISGVADQSNKWIRGSSIPKKMENGSILWNGAMFDITELKIAEEQIRDKENRFRSLIDTAPDATIIMDENGIIRIANLQAESLFGYTKAELTGISVEILMPESFRKQHSSHQKQILEKTNAREMEAGRELVAVKKDGSLVPVEMSLSPFHSDEEILVTASIRDITERKNAEKELEESYKSIRRLTEYLQEVREEERTYIAREIHDELGQQLTVMMMDVAWLNKKIGTENVGVSDKIKELLEMLDNTVKTVRRISTELRPSVLDDLGLVPAIEMHLKDFETRSAILTQLTVPKQDLELADPVKNTLFRIFQESLTNVARHSGAKKVVVKLEVENNIIVLIIEDNGIGFDEQKAATKRTLGVLGMKERAAVIGGEYHISGKRGKGTIIQVKVPLHN